METLKLGDIQIDVQLKEIKNVHLSVYPPTGRVRIAAPMRMDLDTIRIYAISKLTWIKTQQKKFRAQKREAPREYLTKEGHYFLGVRYLLKVVEHNAPPEVRIKHKTIELHVRPDSDFHKKHDIMDEWYRAQLKDMVQAIITNGNEKWGLRYLISESGK